MKPVGIKQRMALCRYDLDILHADAPQFVGHKVGSFLNVAFVFVKRADAGDAKQVFQFAKETLLILAGESDCRGSHGMVLSGACAVSARS
jgi:hypothetical protein